MKKHLIYTMLALAVLATACKKDYTVATADLPEKKVAATLAAYSSALTGSTNGWKAVLSTYGGGTYLFSLKFGTNNRVTMLSDLNATASSVAAESSYLIRQQQAPSLLFDTYNYLHLLADPDPSANSGVAGAGSYSDIEFYFDTVKGDTINLVGNRLGSKLQLIKAAAATDFTAFTTGTAPFLSYVANLRTYFKRMTIGGTDTEIKIETRNRIATFSFLDASNNIVSVSSNFYIDGATTAGVLTTGMVLLTPVTVGTTKVTGIKAITGDAANHLINGTINGAAVQLKEAVTPLKLDVTSPQRWYTQMNNNPNGTWITVPAFHFGIDDYCNFKAVANYSSLWYAGGIVFGGSTEGLISLVNGTLSNPYCLSKPFTYATPGIGRFTLSASSGTFTGTAPLAIAMTAARQIMYNGTVANSFQDFYFVQTNVGGTAYDMVRVGDAQAWVSWGTL